MITLSVHLLTYNSEKYIKDTLDSIISQKVNFNYEIVVGDDCSTDNTLELIAHYSDKHPKLFNIKKNESQLGILGNFKATLDRCKGKYVFDIAGDDLLKSEDALQKMVTVLKNDDSLGFVDSGSDKLYIKNNEVHPFFNKDTLELSKHDYLNKLLLGQAASIGVCFNKKHLYDFVDFETYLNMKLTIEDYPIIVDLAMNTNFELLQEPLNIYRVHEESHSQIKQYNELVFQKTQMFKLHTYFKNKYNFSERIYEEFTQTHYKNLLYLAAFFTQKTEGKNAYQQIKTKKLNDHILYLVSQSKRTRKTIHFITKQFKKN